MLDTIEIHLNEAIRHAKQLNEEIEYLSSRTELIKTFYAPVFNTLVEGSRFLETNLNIVLTRYGQRKAAGKTE